MRFCRHLKPINANFNGMRMVDPTFPMQQQWCRFSWRKNWDKIDFISTTVTDQNLIPWRHRWLLLAGDDIWCKRITAPLNLAAVRPHQGPAAQTWALLGQGLKEMFWSLYIYLLSCQKPWQWFFIILTLKFRFESSVTWDSGERVTAASGKMFCLRDSWIVFVSLWRSGVVTRHMTSCQERSSN